MSIKIIVIGGGPAGLMAAGTAAKYGANVILFEKNTMLGRKLLITGKGRCNVTNFCDAENVLNNINSNNSKFLYSALNAFSCYDTFSFFSEHGVPLKIERGNRVFPESDKASDIRDALKRYALNNGVKILNEQVTDVKEQPLLVSTNDNEYTADKIIIATGGLSYPLTGSTGDGYKFAKKLNHTVTKTQPALVAMLSKDQFLPDVAGLSLKNISIEIKDLNNKIVYTDFGEMLFTHNGVSGPVILSASSKLEQSTKYNLYIDFKPALSFEQLDERILKDFAKYINKDFANSLGDLLPKSIISVVIDKSGIDAHQKVNTITKDQRKQLITVIKAFPVTLYSKAGFGEAIITSGGVSTKQINPKTMESNTVKGIYFAGEIIDLDANTGGYNLQIAFSTGYVAGKSAAMEE